jgi:hypothetical protein
MHTHGYRYPWVPWYPHCSWASTYNLYADTVDQQRGFSIGSRLQRKVNTGWRIRIPVPGRYLPGCPVPGGDMHMHTGTRVPGQVSTPIQLAEGVKATHIFVMHIIKVLQKRQYAPRYRDPVVRAYPGRDTMVCIRICIQLHTSVCIMAAAILGSAGSLTTRVCILSTLSYRVTDRQLSYEHTPEGDVFQLCS